MKLLLIPIIALSIVGCGVPAVKIERAKERAQQELAETQNPAERMFWEGYIAALTDIRK